MLVFPVQEHIYSKEEHVQQVQPYNPVKIVKQFMNYPEDIAQHNQAGKRKTFSVYTFCFISFVCCDWPTDAKAYHHSGFKYAHNVISFFY